jgi:hypothetical protein
MATVEGNTSETLTLNDTLGISLYWVGNGGKYEDTAHWSVSSGGTGGAALPTSVDDIVFDANSFTLDNQVVTGPLIEVWGPPKGSYYSCANLTVESGTREFRMECFDSTALGDPGNALAVPTSGLGYGEICRVILNVYGNINLNSVTCHLGYIKITGVGIHTISGVNNADFWDIDMESGTAVNLETGATLEVINRVTYRGIFNFNAATINAFLLCSLGDDDGIAIHDLSGTSVINIRAASGVSYNTVWSGVAPALSMSSHPTTPSETVDLATTTINCSAGSYGSVEFDMIHWSDPSEDPQQLPALNIGDVTFSNCTLLHFMATGLILSENPTENNYQEVVFKSVSIDVAEPTLIHMTGELHIASADDLIITGASETNTITYYSQPLIEGGATPQWVLNIDDGSFKFKHSLISYCTIAVGTLAIADSSCVDDGNNIRLKFAALYTEPTSETITITDEMVSEQLVDLTENQFRMTDEVVEDHLVTNTTEAVTFTDVAVPHRTTYANTLETTTLTDVSTPYHLVESTTDLMTIGDEWFASDIIRKRIKFPNLQGKHLSLKFESDNSDFFAIYYLRHKMFKTRELTSDQKHPNTHGSHIGIKLSNSGSDEFILMYVSEKMQLVTT